MRGALCTLLVVVPLLACGSASGQNFATSITPDQVLPPSPSTASGRGTFELDAAFMLLFEITISGLHGSETEASLHGPAAAGAEAGVLFTLPLGNSKSGRIGPLTDSQAADLEAGLWYLTIHTSHHREGEIRGQLRSAVAVEPQTWGGLKAKYRSR